MEDNNMVHTEEDLIFLAKEGDKKAMDRLLAIYYNYIHQVCSSIISDDRDDVEEAAQRTMLLAWKNIKDMDTALRPWLASIARSQSSTVLRERREHSDIDAIDEYDLVDPTDPEQEYSAKEQEIKIREAMEKLLTPRQFAALDMWAFSDASYDDIAGNLGCSLNAARLLVSDAMKKMRQHKLSILGEE